MKMHKRILHLLIAVGLIFVVVLLAKLDEEGPKFVGLILGISMILYGIRTLAGYFLKFRHTVGGRSQLYIGIISMDLGLLIISSINVSIYLVLMYLLGIRAIAGGIDLARAMESKRNGAPWVVKLVAGIISLATVVIGVIFFRNPDTVVDIYVIGLLISAVEHVITAFRKTTVVTIA